MSKQEFNQAMGAAIRALRKERGLTLVDVAEKMGYTYQQQQKNECGINGMSAEGLTRLAHILRVSVADLYEKAGCSVERPSLSEAENDAYMAAHHVRRMSKPIRAALLPYLQRMAYSKGETV